MPIRIRPTIPDENIVKQYLAKIKEKYGTLFMFLGRELQEAMKLHLHLKYGVDFSGDQAIMQLLGMADKHTQHTLDDSQKQDLNKVIDPAMATTKTQRAYTALNNLKRTHLEQFTRKEYLTALDVLFEQGDYRTVDSNLEILKNNKSIEEIPMRLGKKNLSKQIYRFVGRNELYIYGNLESLQEFINLFHGEFNNDFQVTLKEIKLFLDREVLVVTEEFVDDFAGHLVENNVLEKDVVGPNGVVYKVLKQKQGAV